MPREPQPTFVDRLLDARPPWFWWGVGLTLASCFALLSWSLCIAIFEHPEIPRNYAILKKIDRLPEPKSFSSETAPELPSTTAEALRSSFLQFSPDELKAINQSLLRSYLKNYQNKKFDAYLTGTFKVRSSRALSGKDLITSGFVVELDAFVQTDQFSPPSPFPAVVKIIFPTYHKDAHLGFKKGDSLELEIIPHFASLIHLSRVDHENDDPELQITVVSLAESVKPPHSPEVKLSPPKEINILAKPPIAP